MKRSKVLVATGVSALVLVVAAGAAYLRFGRAVAVPVVEAVQGKVILRVVGPGSLAGSRAGELKFAHHSHGQAAQCRCRRCR